MKYSIIQKIMEKASNDKDELILDMVNDAMKDFNNYVEIITMEEIRLELAKEKYDPECCKSLIQNLDQRRKRCHDACIANISMLNNICKEYELEPLYSGSRERSIIGDFIGELVNEAFKFRRR